MPAPWASAKPCPTCVAMSTGSFTGNGPRSFVEALVAELPTTPLPSPHFFEHGFRERESGVPGALDDLR